MLNWLQNTGQERGEPHVARCGKIHDDNIAHKDHKFPPILAALLEFLAASEQEHYLAIGGTELNA